jgi:hypothetical protein
LFRIATLQTTFTNTPERHCELLKRLCDDAGRDYDAIEKTAPFAFDVGADGSRVPELWVGCVGSARWAYRWYSAGWLASTTYGLLR